MKMEFVIVMERCFFLTGIISRWNVFTVLAVICVPYLASQETGVVVQNSWVKIIETSRTVARSNANVTSTNQKEERSHVVNVNNSGILHGNESRHIAEDNVYKNSYNPEKILHGETIVTVNNTSRSLKEGTGHVTGSKVNNSWIYPDGKSPRMTEITVNKTSDEVKKSSRSVTIVNVNNNSRNRKEGKSDVTGVKVNIYGINVNEISDHASDVNVTKITTESSTRTDHVAEFTSSTSLNARPRRLMDILINNSSANSNLQSRRVTEGTLNASRTGPYDRSRNETSWTNEGEGSAHGSLSDILGMSDDEDIEGDDLVNEEGDDGTVDFARRADSLEDDGGGGEDEADSAMVPDGNNTVLVTCFRCHGDGINGCDVTTMLGNAAAYSVVCSGKCLNVSSGTTAVYDCADYMQTQTDTCLQNHDTEMCFCTGSFCNGPSLPIGFNLSSSHPYPEHLLPLDFDYYDNEITNSSEEILTKDDVLMQKSTTKSTGNSTNINKSKIENEINDGSIEMKKEGRRFDVKTHSMRSKNDTNPYLQDLFTQNNTLSSQDIWAQFNQNQKNKINFIISESSSDSINNSITKEPLSPNAIGISDLRVGKLKDSLGEEMTKNCQLRVHMFNLILPWVICGLITLLNGL